MATTSQYVSFLADLNAISGPPKITILALSYNYYILLLFFYFAIYLFWLFSFWSHFCTFHFLAPVIIHHLALIIQHSGSQKVFS